MKIFIICSVREANDEYRAKLERYVTKLEKQGYNVYLPHRNTNQNDTGINICKQNRKAIKKADEIHIFYNPESQGTHFDLGVAFAYDKPIKVIENVKYGEGKSYPRMIKEWENENRSI